MQQYHLNVLLILCGWSLCLASPSQAQPFNIETCNRAGESTAVVIVRAQTPIALEGEGIERGDEIALLTNRGACAGAKKWDGESLSIPVSGYFSDDDETVPGYKNGETLKYRIWNASSGKVVKVKAAYDACDYCNAKNTYSDNGIFKIKEISQVRTAEKPHTPSLASPADEATRMARTVKLSWGGGADAETYRVQVGTSDDFSAPAFEQGDVTDAEQEVGALRYATKYYWRVRARNDEGKSDWSVVRTFTTLAKPISVPDAPSLATPADEASGTARTVKLSWGAVAEAKTYRVQVGISDDFSAPAFEQGDVTDAEQEVGVLQYATKYYWRVRARNDEGKSDWSAVRTFTTLAKPISVPDAPSLATPADEASGTARTGKLSWGAVAGAETYHVQVGTSASFDDAPVFEESGFTNVEQHTEGLRYMTQYYWRVQASNQKGKSDWSTVRRFTTQKKPSYPPEAPAIMTPDDGAPDVARTVVMEWSTVDKAESYQVQVGTSAHFDSPLTNKRDMKGTVRIGSGLSFGTKYYWRVRARNEEGPSEWTVVRNFTTKTTTDRKSVDSNPERLQLQPNYPNPFLTSTTLRFDVPRQMYVSLTIYNVLGEKVKTLISRNLSPGRHEVRWQPSQRASGMYFCRLRGGIRIDTQKMVLMR